MDYKAFILKDIKNYGLSQFYTDKGFWSVFEYDNERYSVVLMDKNDRTKQIQSWTNISIDEVVKVIEG